MFAPPAPACRGAYMGRKRILSRVHVRPVGVAFEGIRVEAGGNVAGAPGISIHAPGAANVKSTFQYDNASPIRPAPDDGDTKTKKAAADDQNLKIRSRG
jgi:hypothetical protein